MKNRILYVIAVAIVILVAVMIILFSNNPETVIENKLKLKLPSGTEVIKFNYDMISGGLEAKILFSKQKLKEVKDQLNSFFGEYSEFNETMQNKIPNFENTNHWWDLDKNNIETVYQTFISGGGLFAPKSRNVWAFIVNKNSNDYLLYISY